MSVDIMGYENKIQGGSRRRGEGRVFASLSQCSSRKATGSGNQITGRSVDLLQGCFKITFQSITRLKTPSYI